VESDNSETPEGEQQPEIDFESLAQEASRVFMPASPIMDKDLFAGRIHQLRSVMDAINQSGQHAVLYGERGVGKTSLANVLAPLARAIHPDLASAKVNCDGTDTLDSVWRKAFQELTQTVERRSAGFTGELRAEIASLADALPRRATPADIRTALAGVEAPLLLIFDEFDRLPAPAARLFTDVIKGLSDYAVPTTVVVVGVAQTVEQLVTDHRSIDRALIQIQMPRMKAEELHEIISKGATQLGISFDRDAAAQIVQVSQGLPHYTHLIALHAVRQALSSGALHVTPEDVEVGLRSAVENAQQTIKRLYHVGTTSSHRSALFEQVLLACALARKDQMGTFRAADVEHPLSSIMGRKYDVPAFARHLSEFCSDTRENVLTRSGPTRRVRYSFTNPLMDPYVVMNGRAQGLISKEKLAELTA
jgi:Cdc6-like AAA superfamily ATPase